MARYRMECPLEELMGTPAGDCDRDPQGVASRRSLTWTYQSLGGRSCGGEPGGRMEGQVHEEGEEQGTKTEPA